MVCNSSCCVDRFTASTFRHAVHCRRRKKRTRDWVTTWIEFFTWDTAHTHIHSCTHCFNGHFPADPLAGCLLYFPFPFAAVLCILSRQTKTFHIFSNTVHYVLIGHIVCLIPSASVIVQRLIQAMSSLCSTCLNQHPPILHLASSEQWCWSGEWGILTELSLCLVLCSISAMHVAQYCTIIMSSSFRLVYWIGLWSHWA